MKYWLLGLGCVAMALTVVLTRHFAPAAMPIALDACYAAAGLAATVVAFAYGARDRLRWAWLTFGIAWLVAFFSTLFIGDSAQAATFSPGRVWIWVASIVALNTLSTTALVLFARVWSGTGLSPPWRLRATLLFLLVAFAVDGKTLWDTAHGMVAAEPRAFGAFASMAGDIIGIALVGPIFATAIALRGGVLMRPWAFLFAGSVFWIIDDLTLFIPQGVSRDIDMFARPLAVVLGAGAAVAQYWVKREVSGGLSDE